VAIPAIEPSQRFHEEDALLRAIGTPPIIELTLDEAARCNATRQRWATLPDASPRPRRGLLLGACTHPIGDRYKALGAANIVGPMTRVLAILTVGASLVVGSVSAATLDDGKPKTALTKGGQAWAHRIILKLGDFPPGWRAETDKSDDNSSKCFSRDLSSLTVNGRAESPNFLHGELPLSSSLAAVFATGPQARKVFAALRQALDECLVGEFDKDKNFGDTSGGPLNFPHLGERSFAFQLASHVEQGKLSVAFYVDVVVIQRTRAIALGVFADAFTPFDESLERRLARAMAQRMKLRP
jgi:hypothetical protein